MANNSESFEKICLLCSEIFRILYIGRMPGICWGEDPRDGVNTATLRLRYTFTLIVVGVERSMSETARRTSKWRKIGAQCICDAPKARPEGTSPFLWHLVKNAKF